MTLPVYTRGLFQVGTYWPPATISKTGGQAVGAPVLIMCRWEAGGKMFRTPENEELVSSATVFVDRDVENGGYLAEGDQTAQNNPKALIGTAFQIRNVSDTPDLRATKRLIQTWLV